MFFGFATNHRFHRCHEWLVCVMWFFSATLCTAAGFSSEPSEVFFTNVADRLLQQQLGMRLTEIQIAPANQYDAAVHRIFQVTANIYDATSTNDFPTVFRPIFQTRSNGVFLAGFTNDNRVNTLNAWVDSNPYAIPLVIAARKGFPNFNEFTMWSECLTARRLQMTRPATNALPVSTNVMYTLSVSNTFGLELWNSYKTAYPRAVSITISNFTEGTITNEWGVLVQTNGTIATLTNLAAGLWQGTGPTFNNPASFVVPAAIANVTLPNSSYRFLNPANTFVPINTNQFEILPGFPVPHWSLTLSNRLSCLLADGNRIIDLVLLHDGVNLDLTQLLLSGQDIYPPGTPNALVGIWSTNRSAPGGPTDGILQQIEIAAGDPYFSLTASDWNAFSQTRVLNANDEAAAIRTFRSFMGLPPNPGDPPTPPSFSLSMTAPFNPAAKLVVASSWQANDPLVHTHVEDLRFSPPTNHYFRPTQLATNIAPSTLGQMNVRYSPWGGRPLSGSHDPADYDRAVKDPGVYSADNWNFPTNETLAANWLGRVHRGTPWQTIYLKSDRAPLAEWVPINADVRTHPTNDWRMAALLASLLNTNDVRTLTSINTTNLDIWAATLGGLTVLSNNRVSPESGQSPQFDVITIAASASQVGKIADGIGRQRGAQREPYFTGVAEFLMVPELSSASPWLNLNTDDQLRFGLSDEAYEALPSQLLSLVRADPVGTATRVGNSIELRFTAFDGYAFRIEGSTDLITWTTVSEPNYSTNGVFTLALPATSSPRFFRAVLPPAN